MTDRLQLFPGMSVKWNNLCCVVILSWDQNVIISPLFSENQYHIPKSSILGIYDNEDNKAIAARRRS